MQSNVHTTPQREAVVSDVAAPTPDLETPQAAAAAPEAGVVETAGADRRATAAGQAETIQAPAAQRQQAREAPAPSSPDLLRQRQANPEVKAAKPAPAPGVSPLLETPVPLPRMETAVLTRRHEGMLSAAVETGRPDRRPMDAESPQTDQAAGRVAESAADVQRPRTANSSIASLVQRGRTDDALGASTSAPGAGLAPPAPRVRRQTGAPHEVPTLYRMRVAPNREQVVQQRGGTEGTEAAVKSALRWLAMNQEPDGRWSCQRHGGGRAADDDRQGAGARADAGVTGLALLAFLGAGHTHQAGVYQRTVQAGLDYLMRIQARNGALSGDATTYAAMYCHGMAAFALAEAYGMTGDERLRPCLRKAVAYTLLAQHRENGGWRYRPGDAQGDTSQLGWQLMTLKSAQLATIDVPDSAGAA